MNKDTKILITGARGFIGSALGHYLTSKGFTNVMGLDGTRQGLDLGDDSELGWIFDDSFDVVFHFATRLPTKENCLEYPAGLMYENVFVTSKVLEEARLNGCKKFITMWNSSCYPETTPIPYKEEDLWRGEPHWTKRYYGNSAKVMMEMAMAFATQFPQMTCVSLISPEVYGPNSGFNPRKNKTIESVITNIRASQDHDIDLNIKGTSKTTRDFLYIYDAVEALHNAMVYLEESGVYNISEGVDYSLKELHEIVAEYAGFEKSIFWEEKEQDIQQRSCLNIALAKEKLSWSPKVDIKKGLKLTLGYHDSNLSTKYILEDSIIQR